MGEQTNIGWTDHTFNLVWGCVQISPACAHCYAKSLAERWGFDVWGEDAPRRVFGDKHWAEPLKWNRKAQEAGERRRVFCSSMADVFEDHPTVAQEREKLWPLIRSTPWLDWLLLTKRPENIAVSLPGDWGTGYPNVWLGVTAENQEFADRRVSTLVPIPAAVHFVSVEPILSAVDLNRWLPCEHYLASTGDEGPVAELGRMPIRWRCDVCNRRHDGEGNDIDTGQVDWVILGGESGAHHRGFDLEWARTLRDDCFNSGAAFFFKQHGGRTPDAGGCLLDGQEWKQFPA